MKERSDESNLQNDDDQIELLTTEQQTRNDPKSSLFLATSPLKSYLGIIFPLLSVIFLSFSNILVKKIQLLTGTQLLAMRYSVQLFVMLVIARCFNNINIMGPANNRKLLLLRGFVGTINLWCLYTAIKLINPSDVAALVHTNTIFVAIIARFTLDEKLTLVYVLSMFMALTGSQLTS